MIDHIVIMLGYDVLGTHTKLETLCYWYNM